MESTKTELQKVAYQLPKDFLFVPVSDMDLVQVLHV